MDKWTPMNMAEGGPGDQYQPHIAKKYHRYVQGEPGDQYRISASSPKSTKDM